MTTINDLPVELFRYIFKYCNKKSIINLGKINHFFYTVTKEYREEIKSILDDYPTLTTQFDKNKYIISSILCSKMIQLQTLLELGILHPNNDIGICPSQFSSEGRTAIDYAVLTNNLQIIALFLTYGCNLNKRNNGGYTPLMICIINLGDTEDDLKMLEYLLLNKANTNIESKDGYIAIDYVNSYDRYICDILRYYGSRESTEWILQSCHEHDLIDYDHDIDNENYDESGDYDYDSDEEMSE